MRHVRLASGLALACEDAGDPSGTVVVLLHGYADSHRFWEPVLPHLPGGLRVIAVTQRGHGDSDKPTDGYDLPTLADDVVAFLDAIHVTQAVLVGHSSGGLIAQQVAVDHPDRLGGLVLVGSPPDLWGRTPPFADVVASMVDPVTPEEVREVLGSLDVGRFAVTGEWIEEMVTESTKVPAAVWREALSALARAPSPLGDRDPPAVRAAVVWGAEDAALPRSEQEQLARAWLTELVVVPEGGHLLAWEQPALVAEAIGRFVARQTGGGMPGGAH